MKWIFRNVQVIGLKSVLFHGWVLVRNGRIESLGSGEPPQEILWEEQVSSTRKDDVPMEVPGKVPQASEQKAEDGITVVDGQGGYLSPGFVDLHVHGGGGDDFSDASADAYLSALKTHLRGGTTTILPTLMTGSLSRILENVAVYEALAAHPPAGLPHLEGLHLEGPYFSPVQLGAQDGRYVRLPQPEEYRQILEAGPHIRRWAAACELPGALEFGESIARRGVIPCIGHSDATLNQVRQALQAGYRCVTHLYSSCSMVHRNGPFREGGIVEAAYLFDGLDVEMIGDGIHLPPDFMRMIYQIKGPDTIALITDCIRPGGQNLPEGTISYSDRERQRPVVVESGVAIMPDRKSFAGSIATMGRVVQTAVRMAGIPLWDAVRMASLTPARMLGLDAEIGSIAPGKRADLVLLDKDLAVGSVFIPDGQDGLMRICTE